MKQMSNNSRKILEQSMRIALLSHCKKSGKCTTESKKFIKEEATFEQLLNLVYNPKRQEKYLSSSLLETVAILSTAKMLNIPTGTSSKKVQLDCDFSKLESFVKQMRTFSPVSFRTDVVSESLNKLAMEDLKYKVPLNSLTLTTSTCYLFTKLVKESVHKGSTKEQAIKTSSDKLIKFLEEAKKLCLTEKCSKKYNDQIEVWKKRRTK